MTVDVAALARLARLDVAPEELARLEKEIPAILAFVDEIQNVTTGAIPTGEVRSVMRSDENPHESGIYTEELLAAAPAVLDGAVVVKQVLSK